MRPTLERTALRPASEAVVPERCFRRRWPLDVTLQAQILNLINRLQDEYDLSYVFISHNLNAVRHVCDRTAVMYAGEVAERSKTEQLFENPKQPYTRALLRSVPGVADRHQQQREELPGSPPSAIDPPSGCRFHPRCPEFIDGQCVSESPTPQSIDGDPGHDVACHWTDRPDEERATHTPPDAAARETIEREGTRNP